MSYWITYDIKGIQQYIFSVPKLRYIVGASSLISQFDDDLAQVCAEGAEEPKVTGGGNGTFLFKDKAKAVSCQNALIVQAHAFGLDIRIGMGDSSQKSWESQQLRPYVAFLKAERKTPCESSGMYPVVKGEHDVIYQRKRASSPKNNKKQMDDSGLSKNVKVDCVGLKVLEEMFNHKENILNKDLVKKCRFMRNVRTELNEDKEFLSGLSGQESLGNRGRWAVLAMDGNDIGLQQRYLREQNLDENSVLKKRQEISMALNKITLGSLATALSYACNCWWENLSQEKRSDVIDEDGYIILPFRPIVAGGDDISLLAHPQYAFDLALGIIEEFKKQSASYSDLWAPTGGRLSISAGILFIKNSYPLNIAIEYAERLLKSAKNKGKTMLKSKDKSPSLAMIDFDHITESLLDSPEQRRIRLNNESCGNIDLTCRPYSVEQFSELSLLVDALQFQNKVGEGRHLLCEILQNLRESKEQRRLVAWRIRKHKPLLADLLSGKAIDKENDTYVRKAWPSENRTRLADAILLMEEAHRMTQETQNKDDIA